MKRIIAYLGIIIFIFLVLGCSTTKNMAPKKQPAKEQEKKTGIVNEFFDPLILDDDDLKVKKTISAEPKSDQAKEDASQSGTEFQKMETVAGFRVQICAVSNEERAKEIQRDALLKFINEDVYLIYDSPYYKVRVGNCPTRYEADKLQQLAVEKGFEDAWVVRTNITVKQNDYSPKN